MRFALFCALVGCAARDDFDAGQWQNPPATYAPLIRWWWPGGAVESGEIDRELTLLGKAGFGGVEVQPLLLGLSPDEIANDPAIRSVGTASFFASISAAEAKADALGLAFDVTLGSGWPSGGPFVAGANSESQLLLASMTVTGPATFTGPLPAAPAPSYTNAVESILDALGPIDPAPQLVAVTAAEVVADNQLSAPIDLSPSAADGQLQWSVPAGTWNVFAFYQSQTNHKVLGGAYPGTSDAALVVDHLSPPGAQAFISGYAAPLVTAMGNKPRTLFVDSFELIGELPWTSDFISRFITAKGYDPTPLLPFFFRTGGEAKYTEILSGLGPPRYIADGILDRAREDYEDVRGQAFVDGFVSPMLAFAHARGEKLRLQAHGGYSDVLDTYAMADIPETEQLYAGGSYDFLKLAASAAHVAGKTLASSESYVAVLFGLTPQSFTIEDFYGYSGRLLSAGINHIVHHGYPYLYQRTTGERWFPFSGETGTVSVSPLPISSDSDEDHPAFSQFAALNRYVARLCYAMSRGEHLADVAWLLNEQQFPDNASLSYGFTPGLGESDISTSLKNAGLIYDRVSRAELASATVVGKKIHVGKAQYAALLLSDVSVLAPEVLATAVAASAAGIPVIVVGDLPTRAPGLVNQAARDAQTQSFAQTLSAQAQIIVDDTKVGPTFLSDGVAPALATTDGSAIAYAVDRRSVNSGELILLFNESDAAVSQKLTVRDAGQTVTVFDPSSGSVVTSANQKTAITITAAARRAVLLKLSTH